MKNERKYTTEESREIAGIIHRQLGGGRFNLMTGAKNFGFGDGSLSFKIGRNAKKVTHVTITLRNDLYDMKFIRIHGAKMTTLFEIEGVFNDQLQSIFTEQTELYTSL